jgi:hypothetical protein
MNERTKELIQMADLCAAGLMASGATEEEIQARSKVVLAELVRADERKKVAEWMTERGYTTDHGDTTIKLVRYLEWQVAEKERESCLKLADGLIRAIRTRGKPPPSGLYLVSEPTEQSKRG